MRQTVLMQMRSVRYIMIPSHKPHISREFLTDLSLTALTALPTQVRTLQLRKYSRWVRSPPSRYRPWSEVRSMLSWILCWNLATQISTGFRVWHRFYNLWLCEGLDYTCSDCVVALKVVGRPHQLSFRIRWNCFIGFLMPDVLVRALIVRLVWIVLSNTT